MHARIMEYSGFISKGSVVSYKLTWVPSTGILSNAPVEDGGNICSPEFGNGGDDDHHGILKNVCIRRVGECDVLVR